MSHGRCPCAICAGSMLDVVCCPVLYTCFIYQLPDLKQPVSSGRVRSCHALLVTWNGRGTIMDFGRYTASLRVTGIYDHNKFVC